MKLNISLFTTCLLLTTPTWAMFCPNSFNQIELGNNLDTIKQQCGAPDSEKKSTEEPSVPQEWDYFLQVSPPQTGTLKMSISFVEDKVVNMSVNGIGVSSTAICKGNAIGLKSTMEEITKRCGKPAFVQKADATSDIPPTLVNVWTYNSVPPVTMTFKNGKLTSVE